MKKIDPRGFVNQIWKEALDQPVSIVHGMRFLLDFARTAFHLFNTNGADARQEGLPPGGERLACQLWLTTFDPETVFIAATEAYVILLYNGFEDEARKLVPYITGREETA